MRRAGALISFLILFLCWSCNDEKQTNGNANKAVAREPDHPGKLVYMQFCLSCHMVKAEGVPGLYPPLTQTEAIAGDEEKLIEILLNGQQGAIMVNGESYNNVMTKLDFLTDQQVAEVLSYVRSNFGNTYAPVSVEKVRQVRNSLPR